MSFSLARLQNAKCTAPLFLSSVLFSISLALNSKSSLAVTLVPFPDGGDTSALIHVCADLSVLAPALFSQNSGVGV